MKKKFLLLVLWITPLLYTNAQGFHFEYRNGADYPDKAKMPEMLSGKGRSFVFHHQFKNTPWLWINLEAGRTDFQHGPKWETFSITAYDGMNYDMPVEFIFSAKMKKHLLGIRLKDPKRWYLPHLDLQVGLGKMINKIEYHNLDQPQGTMPYYFSHQIGVAHLAYVNWYQSGGDRRSISKYILTAAGIGWSIPMGRPSRCPLSLNLSATISYGGKMKYINLNAAEDISPQPYSGEVNSVSNRGVVSEFYVDNQIYDPRSNTYHEDNTYYQIALHHQANFVTYGFRVGLTLSFGKLIALDPLE